MRHTVPQYMFSPPPSRNGYHTSKSTPRCPLLKLNCSPAKELRLHSTESLYAGTDSGSRCTWKHASFGHVFLLQEDLGRALWKKGIAELWGGRDFQKCLLQLHQCSFLSLRHCHFNRKKTPSSRTYARTSGESPGHLPGHGCSAARKGRHRSCLYQRRGDPE